MASAVDPKQLASMSEEKKADDSNSDSNSDESLKSVLPRNLKGKNLINEAVKYFTSYCLDPTLTTLDEAVRFLSQNPIDHDTLFAVIKNNVIKENGSDVWPYLRDELKKTIDTYLDVDDGDNDLVDRSSVAKWRALMKADAAKDRSTKMGKSKSSLPQHSKIQITLPQCDGSPGRAHRWWKSVVSDLTALADPELTVDEQLELVPAIRSAMTDYEPGRVLLNQLVEEAKKDRANFDIHTLMQKFTSQHDEHALDHLYREWKNMSQKDSETIRKCTIRWKEHREDMDRLGCVIADAEAWVHYRNSITRASDVREKPDIKTIEAANDYISRVETSQLRSTGSGIAPLAANIYQPRRCDRCHRLFKHHNRTSPFGKRCKFKPRTLEQQLRWEKDNFRNNNNSNNNRNNNRNNNNPNVNNNNIITIIIISEVVRLMLPSYLLIISKLLRPIGRRKRGAKLSSQLCLPSQRMVKRIKVSM